MPALGSIVWRAASGGTRCHHAKSTLDLYAAGTSAFTTFCNDLRSHSNCRLFTRNWQSIGLIDGNDPTEGSNADRKAKIFMRHPDGPIVTFSYPDPVAADVEVRPEGERLTSAALDVIVSLINTLTGQAYTPLYGVVEKKR